MQSPLVFTPFLIGQRQHDLRENLEAANFEIRLQYQGVEEELKRSAFK
jgi:hypothetical protein